MNDPKMELTNPLTDKDKELRGAKIEYLTPEEVLDKYGDCLSDKQKEILGLKKEP